ncbi:MAG: hypothetical protein QM760_11315 [Nibricoccus sp.]
MLDAMEGVTQQDKAIAGEAIKEKKPIVIIVNKWDLVKKTFKKGGGFLALQERARLSARSTRRLFSTVCFSRLARR